MASAFNLTAQINLRGPGNIKPVVAQIKRELNSIEANVNLKVDNRAVKAIDSATNRINVMNRALVAANNSASSLNQTFTNLASALNSVQARTSATTTNFGKTSQNVQKVAKNIQVARTEMEEFGKQSALAIRRFAAFSVVTSGIFALTNAITSAFRAFIDFDKELIRLQQVTGRGAIGVKILQNEITNLATSLGVSSEGLTKVATTLAQAGFTIEETRVALKALAKTELAPSFDNLVDTTEGAIAALRQFGLQAAELESALGSINAVAAAFAVESSDIITAIQRTGGVFAAASKGVSEGTDALNEFVAIFTSVRATTRESAETIATGLRTIFTRIQRADTIRQLKQFGVNLQDLEGKFVGPFEAVQRLSEALNRLDPRDVRFSTIVEELGGFRQIGKVIPLIQQFATAQQALGVAQRGQSSLTDAQIKAQQSLANQLAKVREQFLALIRDIGQSTVFTGLFKIVLGLTSGFISLASAFKPILPILAIFTAIKGVSAVTQFASGFFGGLKKGGGAGAAGQNIGSSITGSKERERAEATNRAADAIRLNTDALKGLTTAVNSLETTIRSRGSATLNGGGKVMGFARGGVVPGSGNRDTVPAMLMPGEFVIRKKAVEKLGTGNLHKMNKYAAGGKVKNLLDIKPDLNNYYDTDNKKDLYNNINIKRPQDKISFKQSREQYRSRAEAIWKQASEIYSIENDIIGANEFIKKKTRINPGFYDTKELDPKNISPRRFNRIQGALAEQTTRTQTQGLSKLPNSAGADFVYRNSNGTKFIEVKNKITPTSDEDLVSKALLGYAYIRGRSPKYFKNQELDNIAGLDIELRSTNPLDMQALAGGGKVLGARSRFKELSQQEIAQLSTSDLIQYGKDLMKDIFTTGGAGMAIGNEFIEVPKERIIPELDQYLTSYLGKRGFWREKVAPFGKEIESKTTSNTQINKQAALESQIAKQADEVAAREQQWTKIRSGSEIDNYILSKLQEPVLSDYKTVRSGGSLSKTFHNTRLRQSVNKVLEEYDDFDYSASNIDKLVSGMAAERFGLGGLIQKFAEGGLTQSTGQISQDILDRIKALGGPGGVKGLAAKEVLEAVRSSGAGTAGRLLDSRSLISNPNSAKFAPYLETVLKAAEEAKRAKQGKIQEQIERNMRASAGGAYQFGLASIYGPNGELGFDKLSNAVEIEGKDGQKYLTQIVQKSLPTRYAQAIEETKMDLAGAPSRGAARMQYADIFGSGDPLAFDFDETLVKGADIPGKKALDYNDLTKVESALENAELTLLGKELAKRLIDYPKLMDNIRVLTARPQSNDSLLAATLSRLSLPIPASKITGVSGGLNKVNNLSEFETLIDDNMENIESVLAGGKRAIPYSEPAALDQSQKSSSRNLAMMESYAFEEMLRSLGVSVTPDEDANPLRPIDYPGGLGKNAYIWGFKPNMPVDTKRTNSSDAVSRLFEEAQKYYIQNFARGGKVRPDYFSLEKDSGFSAKEFNMLAYEAKTNEFTLDEFREFLAQRQQEKQAKANLRMNPYDVWRAIRPPTPTATPKQLSLAESLKGAVDAKYNPKYDNAVKPFAKGGSAEDTVPALLTPGEFVINRKAAKRIGYTKLHKLNQADKLGIKGYNSGGMVGGIQRFEDGGSISVGSVGDEIQSKRFILESKQAKKAKLEKQRDEASDSGDFEKGAELQKEIQSLESEIANIESSISASEEEFKKLEDDLNVFRNDLKKAGMTLREEIRKQFEALTGSAPSKEKVEAIYERALKTGGKVVDSTGKKAIDVTSQVTDISGIEGTIQNRENEITQKFGDILDLPSLKETSVEDFVGRKQSELTAEQEKKKGLEARVAGTSGAEKALLTDEIKRTASKIDELNQTIDAAKESYSIISDTISAADAAEKSAQAELDAAQEAIVAVLRKKVKGFDDLDDATKQAAVEKLASGEKITSSKGKEYGTPQLAADVKAAQEKLDAAKTAKSTAEQRKEILFPSNDDGLPKINPQIAKEKEGYFKYRAEKAGMSASGYRLQLAEKLGAERYNVRREAEFGQTEAKNLAIGKRTELKGVNVKTALEQGSTTAEGQRVQAIIGEFTDAIRKANPALTFEEARQEAITLATGLSDASKSVQEVIDSNENLKKSFTEKASDETIQKEALRRTSLATGETEETIRNNVSSRAIKQQEFIQSVEGQRFGGLARLAPGLTERLSKTKLGRGLGAGADFISGKGGALSQGFAKVGGFAGIGGAVAGGAEALKQFLPKSVTSDPNTAGALGALSGAGSGAAVGAQLGSFAGPIGTLVGGVGGAIIGGIQGFFSAKNQAVLTNALENVAKTTGDLDNAFKKLDADASKVNFDNAQKAFGDVVNAGKDIESMAFAKTGFQSLGDTFSGGVDKLSTGFAEGDISKIVLGGLQTAFGATGGGLLVDYFSAPSEAQRTEAVGAMVAGGSQKNEAASRLAETGLKSKSTEELGAIFDNIKNGTNELNPITEQYVQGALKAAEAANGTKQLTAEQTKNITAQAQERAALDAYMKKRKESGATDDQIAKELSKNRADAVKEGEAALKVQGEIIAKQALLARATKEVAVATESLLDVYRRTIAEADRYSSELDQFSADVNAMVAGLGGDTSMREVNRQNEQVLGNVSAYSMEEVQAAADSIAGLGGGTPEAKQVAASAVSQKIVQDQIPALLKAAGGDTEQQDAAVELIRQQLESQGLQGSAINTIINDLKTELQKGQGLTESELGDAVSKSFSTVGKGLEALQKAAKVYNDTLAEAKKLQQAYNKAILEANSYTRKATQVRLNAELDLAKALGRSPTLEELNKPFDVEIGSLTSGLVASGQLSADQAADPMAIMNAITAAENKKAALEKQSPELLKAAGNLPEGEAGNALREKLNQEQLANIEAIGGLTVASAEGRAALEKLANDGSKAANALAKIQEEQQAMEGFGNFAEKVFTAEPEELMGMEMKARAFNMAQGAGPDFFKSRFNRQQAFAGLEQEKEFMTPDEYKKERASLIRKSFESQGYKGTDVVKQIAGKDVTLDELTKRLEGGIDETDPNVIKFREASEVQAKANEALGQLNLKQAFIIQQSMEKLEDFFTNRFPDIFTKAATKAQEDAATKPQTKTKETAKDKREKTETEIETKKDQKATLDREIGDIDRQLKEETSKKWMDQDPAKIARLKEEKQKKESKKKDLDRGIKMAEDRLGGEKTAEAAEAKANAEAKARQAEEKKAKAEKAIKSSEEARGGTAFEDAETQARYEKFRRGVGEPINKPTEEKYGSTKTPSSTAQTTSVAQQATKPVTELSKAELQDKIKQLRSQGKQGRDSSEYSQAINLLNTQKDAEKQAKLAVNKRRALGAALPEYKKMVDAGTMSKEAYDAKEKEYQALRDTEAQQRSTGQQTGLVNSQNRNRLEQVAADASSGRNTSGYNANDLRLPSTPVPVTMPTRAQEISQQTAAPQTGVMEASAITINPDSIKALETFNTNFAEYVDRLRSFEFPTIPEKIEMNGNHVVDVRISGAAAFEGLKKDFQGMMKTEISKAMGKIWGQSNGQMGERPSGTETPA